MPVVPLNQTVPASGQNTTVYLPAIYQNGQKLVYSFVIPNVVVNLPDNVVVKSDMVNFIANNSDITTTGIQCVCIYYEPANNAAKLFYAANAAVTNFGWVPITNQQGVLMFDSASSIYVSPSSGKNQKLQQDFAASVSSSGAVQVTFPTPFSSVSADMCFSLTVAATTADGTSPFSASVITGNPQYPISTTSFYINIIGTPPKGSAVFVRAVGNK